MARGYLRVDNHQLSHYNELLGPQKFLTWSQDNGIWWALYRTTICGSWLVTDAQEFVSCTARYIIFFDHTKDSEARLFAIRVLERDGYFKACKVSNFARDGEKVMVFLGKGAKRKAQMDAVCKEMGFILHSIRYPGDLTETETELSNKYDEYLKCLQMAFRNMDPSGAVHAEVKEKTE